MNGDHLCSCSTPCHLALPGITSMAHRSTTSRSTLLDDVALFGLSFGLQALTGSTPSLLFELLLLVLIAQRVPRDLESRTFFTPFPVAAGIILSYTVAISTASDISVLEKLYVIGPTSLSIAVLVYAIVLLSHGVGQLSKDRRCGSTVQLLAFPMLWCTGWALYCYWHPLGRLLAWTPVPSMGGFSVVLPLLGLPGYDFIVGCLVTAIVTCWRIARPAIQTAERDLVDYEPDERSPLLSPRLRPASSSTGRPSTIPLLLLVTFLFALWTASTAIYGVPRIAPSGETITIGCVLPRPRNGESRPTLAQYMQESEIVSGKGAKILLWPEAAVPFSSRSEYASFDNTVRLLAQRRRAYIAPSFTAQPHYLRNGLPDHWPSKEVIATTLVSPAGETVYAYFKQSLVPIAESYNYERGLKPLPREEILVPQAGSQSPVHGTNISLSTAICHDTSFPSVMRQAHPSSLVLVPSSVFSEGLANTRISQLQASAQALGSAYLVCDASESGTSTFIDQDGQMRYFQRGPGSFDVNATLDQSRRTPYGKYGETGALAILLGFVMACILLETVLRAGRSALAKAGEEVVDSVRARVYLWTGWRFFRQPERESRQASDDLI